MKRILLIGQCTLHWGRMEFGNIGNYYILEPLIRELHKAFPHADIRTTFQLSEQFCARERVTCVPMELYYAWDGKDLERARGELQISQAFVQNGGRLTARSPYIEEVLNADLVVDFSGDIWGG